MIALNAELTIQKSGAKRVLPIADFFNDDGIEFMKLCPDELVTHVTIPPCNDRLIFSKYAARKGIDFSIGSIAARCNGEGEQTDKVSLILGSLSTAPIKLTKAAEIIQTKGLTDGAIEQAADTVRGDLGEVTNLYSRAVYKKQIARVLVKRTLTHLKNM